MKKWIFLTTTALCLCTSVTAQNIDLEKWSYDGLPSGSLSTALSETGTGSYFGSGASFLTVLSSGVARLTASGAANESYAGGLSPSSYTGKKTGIFEISYIMKVARFTKTSDVSGKGQFGWGLRSTASGTEDDCNVLFQFNAGVFELLANDQSGTTTSTTIGTGDLISNVKIRQLYNLNIQGTPGSFRVYYTIGTDPEVELLPGQMTIHSDFSLNEFRMDVQTTANGNNWIASDFVIIDDLTFSEVVVVPKLTFIQEAIDFDNGGDKGVIDGQTYEPGDVLQIITTNKNETVVTVTDVSTSLSADPLSFSISPLSATNFASLDPNEIYTATYQVEILDGATNGPNTFTVINQIGSGTSTTVFRDSF